MKKLKKIIIGLTAMLFVISCYKGIDPITPVAPGPDLTAPQIKITYPLEGTKIKVKDIVTSINIQFEVTDDIEIGSINVTLDGNQIGTYSSFKDYRHAIEEIAYDNLTNGDHVLKITATDLDGKETVQTVNFSKVSPYTPLFSGEVLYMPFDGDYLDLISFQNATKVGTPGFTDDSFAGSKAYLGATDSYLTFPLDGLNTTEFSAGFWYKVDANPDRGGILTVGNDIPEDRTKGFRLFREGDANNQRIKLNVGYGTGESWNDGGVIDVTAGQWIYIAFTVSQTETKIYFNGVEMNTAAMGAAVDWTGCTTLSIGSGAPTFSYWGHLSDNSPMDELRIFNKALTQSEIQNIINVTNPYTPKYSGETFYMPFDNTDTELISGTEATMVGTTGFADEAHDGTNSFKGATDSYLTYPIDGLFGNEFSGSFWYKVDANPDRGGILTVGNDVAEDRTQGFRLFREGDATNQRIKLNVGYGTGESWNDGDLIDVTAGQWVHIVFTVSATETNIYFDGVLVNTAAMGAAASWTGCTDLTIGSGAPSFTYWGHLSDNSSIDDLRLFNKALTLAEVQTIYNDN